MPTISKTNSRKWAMAYITINIVYSIFFIYVLNVEKRANLSKEKP